MRHHLLERRIGDQEGRDDAGMRRIGAAELKRGRRAVGFRIAGVGGQPGGDLVGGADDRIETIIGVVAVEQAAELVLQDNVRVVESAAGGDRESLGDVERVERV